MMQKNHYVMFGFIAFVVVLTSMFFAIASIVKIVERNQIIVPQEQPTNKKTNSDTDISLGGQIFQQVQNPIQEKLPDTNPMENANPIQGAYTNPF